jgi:hypothetical protein
LIRIKRALTTKKTLLRAIQAQFTPHRLPPPNRFGDQRICSRKRKDKRILGEREIENEREMVTQKEKERAVCGLLQDVGNGEQGAANLQFDHNKIQN